MSPFPTLTRSSSANGEPRYCLGDPLVDCYLEFVAGRCRAHTLRAVAFDLKTFFGVVDKAPADVVPADVFPHIGLEFAVGSPQDDWVIPGSPMTRIVVDVTAARASLRIEESQDAFGYLAASVPPRGRSKTRRAWTEVHAGAV